MLNWFKRKGAAAPKYQRTVTDMDRRFYTADAEFYDQTPKSIAEAIDNLSKRLALPAKSETYPLSPETIAQASAAFAETLKASFGLTLNHDDPDPAQLDRAADPLIDPQLQPFFENGKPKEIDESQQDAYDEALGKIHIPRETLLYYAMGSFHCMWLVRHRKCEICLYEPLPLVQSFPDMLKKRMSVGVFPFSQVIKRLCDPVGDNLEYKNSSADHLTSVPFNPLLASFSDFNFALRQSFPEPGAAAMDAEEAKDFVGALKLYKAAIQQEPQNIRLLCFASVCALENHDYALAEAWMLQVREKFPHINSINSNLAIVYSETKRISPAIRLMKDTVKFDPSYEKGHFMLATWLEQCGCPDDAAAHLNFIIENEMPGKDQAIKFMGALRRD